MPTSNNLSKREKQVMDTVYRLGEATVKEVLAELEDKPSYSAIRAVLSRLESKGELASKEDGPRYVYSPAEGMDNARESALKKLVNTFFDGSPMHTMSALLGISGKEISKQELDALEDVIRKAKEEHDGNQSSI